MKNLEKKNTLAKVLLIIGVVYALAGIVVTAYGHSILFDGMSISEYITQFGERYSSFYSLLFPLRIIEGYLIYGLWIMWVLVIAMDKKSIRIPAIATLSYCIIHIAISMAVVIKEWGSFFDVVRASGLTFLILAAWLLLVIDPGKRFRIVYAVIRWFVLAVDIIFGIYYFMIYLGDLRHGSLGSPIYPVFSALDVVADLIIAAFVLWILKPELFEKKK